MNRITGMAWGLALLAGVFCSAAWGAVGDVQLTVPASDPESGTTFVSELQIELGTQPLGSYTLDVVYDAGVVRITQVQGGTTTEFAGAPVHNTADYEDGSLRLAQAQAAQTVANMTASVARITFEVIGAPGASGTIEPQNITLEDATLDTAPIASQGIAGTVTVAEAAAPALEVTPANRNMGAAGGPAAFNIVTTAGWTAASNQGWAAVTTGSGTGNATLSVNCVANSTTSPRSATITVTGNGTDPAAVSVTVMQEGKPPTLEVTPASRQVAASGGTASFAIATTEAWTAASNRVWATVNDVSGTGASALTVTCAENMGAGARSATITVTGSGTEPQSVNVTITQLAPSADPTLEVTPSSRSVAPQGGPASFSIVTTAGWTAASNRSWAAVVNGSGAGDDTLAVNCSANSSGSARTATITVTGEGTEPGAVSVSVTQGPQGTLAITPSTQNVAVEGDTVLFDIEAEGTWSASSDSGWAAVVNAAGTGDAQLAVNCGENDTGEERVAVITVTDGEDSVTADVVQAGDDCTEAPAAPEGLYSQPAPDGTPGQIELSWDPVGGATYYTVYQRIDVETAWTVLAETENTFFVDDSAPPAREETPASCFGGCSTETIYTAVEYYVTAGNNCGESAPSDTVTDFAWKEFRKFAFAMLSPDVLVLALLVAVFVMAARRRRRTS